MEQKRILYVASTSKGGSAFSLFHMMQGLDRNQYEPMVVFYAPQGSFIESRMQESGARMSFLTNATLAQFVASPPAIPLDAASADDLSTGGATQDIGRWLAERLGKGVSHVYHLWRSHYKYLREDAPRARSLIRLIRDNQIDLVHANNSLRSAKPAIKAAKIAGIPCVSHVRGFSDLKPHDLIFARSVDLFVYISCAVCQHYHRQGVSAPGVVVHNAVNLDDFPGDLDNPQTARAVRNEFGWAEDTPVVGLVGRLDWWKGHETFIQAIANATHHVPGLKALIVGAPVDTPQGRHYRRKLHSLIKSLRLENTVTFTGFRSDVPRLMAAMDILVLSSSTPEPFGRVVIEGMAAGKPVVATAAGGVLDIIQDRKNGRLVQIDNADAMAGAIIELALHPQDAKRMGLAARQRVEARFTLPRQIDTIQRVYSTILSTPKHERPHIQWQHVIDAPGFASGQGTSGGECKSTGPTRSAGNRNANHRLP